jgi:ABC-2 type transport system permease protein
MTAITTGSSVRTILAMTQRYLLRVIRIPAVVIPSLLMPVFFVVIFTGSFSGITQVDGYGTDNVYNWMTAYAVAQAGAFSGSGVGGALVADLETGFFDRLLLSPGRRSPILIAAVLYGMIRALVPITAVIIAAVLIGGMSIPGGVGGVAMLYLQGLSVAAIIGLLAASIALALRTQQSMMLSQIFVFALTFLSIGQVPMEFLSGWLHSVARVNPMTNIFRLGRQGLLGDLSWTATWPGLVATAACFAVLGPIAFAQLRRLAP